MIFLDLKIISRYADHIEVTVMRRKIEDRLLEWKNRKDNRKPLLINGARQVGKTYALMQFGEQQYENVVYVNLEINVAIASFFRDDISPERLIRLLEASTGQVILPGKTLLILDEIQSCERALTSLKYFCEMAPDYHVAAAGSLLGVAIHRERYSFPVGKVDSLTLHPLDFEEFLWANGQERLSQEIRLAYVHMTPMAEALHLQAIDLYRSYLIVGGMPAAVRRFVESGKLVLVPVIQNEIAGNYAADMAKYASATEAVRIRSCWNSIPAQLAKENRKFQYKVVQRGGSAAWFGESIEWLMQAGVVLKSRKTEQGLNPIAVYEDLSSFKLYMSDVGLLVMKSGLPMQTVLSGESNGFMGAVTENYVAQALTANGHSLFYWTSEHTAEIDFVLQTDDAVIAVEVKKGERVGSRSLGIFEQKYRPGPSIRLSEKNFGRTGTLRSIPLYAAFCV